MTESEEQRPNIQTENFQENSLGNTQNNVANTREGKPEMDKILAKTTPNLRSGILGESSRTKLFEGPRGQAKYAKMFHTHIQISLPAVKNLVVAMDSDNDGRVTLDDIIKYAHKHNLFLKQEVCIKKGLICSFFLISPFDSKNTPFLYTS